MPGNGPRPRARPGSSRASLACIPCRTRHIRCDATRPCCRRCSSYGKECHYEKSRRGGLDREALAARRTREAPDATLSGSSDASTALGSADYTLAEEQGSHSGGAWHSPWGRGDNSESGSCETAASILIPQYPGSDPTGPLVLLAGEVEDPLIELYYEHFHSFHPYLLPLQRLQKFLQDPTKRPILEPLVSVIRFIGSIYGRPSESAQLKENAGKCSSEVPDPANLSERAFMTQSRLLLSIALYWSTDMEESRFVLDHTIRDAFDLGMYRRGFATENSNGDPVLAESWRRTWWQIYIVDAYYAAIRRSPKFLAQEVEATVELPCSEREYQSGLVPVPKTLQDFENREFAPEDPIFSSFAYLVGAVRCVASATAAASQEKPQNVSAKVIEAADAIIDGWFLMLPESKQQVMSKDGTIDELMFQAHMGLHAAIVGLHRPYSNLLFNPLEIISSCAMGPPDSALVGELVNIHTVRCLKSIEAQIRLMALPSWPFRHTPFVICMMTAGTIPHLSACKFLFTSERLELARHQIRMSMGCLKEMATIWPQAAVHVRELQTIAQEVLGLSSKGSGVKTSRDKGASDDTGSGSSTAVDALGMQSDGGFPLDLTGDEFQEVWNNMQPDLACYDFAPIN